MPNPIRPIEARLASLAAQAEDPENTIVSVKRLMGRKYSASEVRKQIDDVLAQFAHHTIRFDHIVTRRAGQRRFVDVHMHMPANWTLGRAAALRTSVEQALMSAVPGLRASIQLLPTDVEAHFGDPKDLV